MSCAGAGAGDSLSVQSSINSVANSRAGGSSSSSPQHAALPCFPAPPHQWHGRQRSGSQQQIILPTTLPSNSTKHKIFSKLCKVCCSETLSMCQGSFMFSGRNWPIPPQHTHTLLHNGGKGLQSSKWRNFSRWNFVQFYLLFAAAAAELSL